MFEEQKGKPEEGYEQTQRKGQENKGQGFSLVIPRRENQIVKLQ